MGPSRTAIEDEFEDIGDEFEDVGNEFEDIETSLPSQPQRDQEPLGSMWDVLKPKPHGKPVYAEEKSSEEIKKMTGPERTQYAQDLKTDREFKQSKGFIKGALSGPTVSLSEKIPGLSPEEDDYLFGFGEFLGSALPISKLYNYLGKPLVKMAAKSPIARKRMESLARMTGFGLTGAAYEGAKGTIRTGEVPSAEELALHGASWAAFDGALQLIGKAAAPFLAKMKNVADVNAVPEKEVLNQVIDSLTENKIDFEKDPEMGVKVAEQVLDNIQKPKAKGKTTEKPTLEEKIAVAREPKKVTEFTTEKGSTYKLDKEGRTTRNKAFRPEHGEAEQGPQPKSEKTYFVSKEDADKLSLVQTQGGPKKIYEFPDGKIGVMYLRGRHKGNIEAGTLITPKTNPEVGLTPLETWDNGNKVHFGNRIIETVSKAPKVVKPKIKPVETPKPAESKLEIKPAKMESKLAEEAKVSIPEPIIETTGEGAGQRHQYAKTRLKETMDGVNKFIKAAKTPVQTFKRTTAAMDQAVFNFLAPLEKLEKGLPAAEKVTSKIKMAQSVNSEINSVLENGIFSNMTGQFEKEGLKGAYGDLQWKKFTSKNMKPEEFSLQDLDIFRTSKIALERQKQGKRTGVDTEKAKADVKSLEGKYGEIDKRIRDFQKNIINQYGKELLGEELSNKFNNNYYSPLYRVMDSGKDSILSAGSLEPSQPWWKFKGSERLIVPPSESDPFNASMMISNARKNDAVLQYMKGVQEGKLPGKIKAGKNESIPEEVLENMGIDGDMEDIAEQLYNQTRKEGFTPEENILRCWKDGKPIDIFVPEEIYDVFKSSSRDQLSPLAKVFNTVNRLFSRSISLEPRKFGSIVSRDALSSLIYSKTGSNPMSVFEALGDIQGNKQIYQQFKAMGGDVYAGRLATRIDRADKVADLITPGKEGIMVPFDKMFSFFKKYPQTLSDISMAVPLAEYKRALEVFGDTAEGRIAAAMEARRVTYDPTRRGGSKLVNGIGNFTPFWNVSLQDMSMLGQNLRNKSTWIKGIAGISLPTIALKMYNEDNPDYQALTPVDKAAFWHIFTPQGHVRIPIPWLLGTTFKVGAESFFDTAKSLAEKNDERAKETWSGMYKNLVQNISGSLPPLLQLYIEQVTGRSPGSPVGAVLGVESKAPEVVPKRLEGLPPELQYTSKTSQVARYFGKLWNMSPIKIERGIKNIGGLVAADALALTDEIAYWSGMAEDKRPEQNEKNYLLLGNFVSENTPSRTKYQTDFYEMLHEKTTQNKARKILKGYGDPALDNVDLVAYNKDISAKLKYMRDIEDSSVLSPAAKREKLLKIQQDVNRLYKQAVDKVKTQRNKLKNK